MRTVGTFHQILPERDSGRKGRDWFVLWGHRPGAIASISRFPRPKMLGYAGTMISVFRNRTYTTLFSAQVIALLGTGLLTIALGLLAFDLAGANAGAVLGTAYAIKMVAYVGLAPVASALADRLPRRAVLIGADIVRALVALSLPFIDAAWQIYLLIFVLQAASATFTPAFQAVIPDILPDEDDYTRALSLSRLAYDLENMISPVLAGALLLVVSYHWLFLGTVLGFLGSAVLVWSVIIPESPKGAKRRTFRDRLTRGTRIYLATPRLRGLLALTLTAAAASAFVLVNTVVMVRVSYGAGEIELAFAMAAFGTGSMITALAMPGVLGVVRDRSVMLGAAFALAVLMLAHGAYLQSGRLPDWWIFLLIWWGSGALYSAILTPAGRLLRSSAHAEDRPALFAAQFALSHTCWLVTYPVAGYLGVGAGLPAAMLVLGGLGLVGVLTALVVWPSGDHRELVHDHPDLAPGHPHFAEFHSHGKTHRHRHVFVIDDEHRAWPTHG